MSAKEAAKEEAQPKSLVSKLAEVMEAVDRIPKRGRNNFHNYDYATEADIVSAIRQELASRHIMLLPSVESERRESVGEKGSVLTVLRMHFTFMDGETGQEIAAPWFGCGSDKDDKGIYKAMTGGEKYFLLKTFLIPTGDDPEADTKDAAQKAQNGARATSAKKPDAKPTADEKPATALLSAEQRHELQKLAEEFGWQITEVKELLTSHGFANSKAVTVDAFQGLCDILKEGTGGSVEVGKVQPSQARAF